MADMDSEGSVTVWIGQLKAGDDDALARLHRRFWPMLVGLARKKLRSVSLPAADEEDVAQQAFWSFYRSLRSGRVSRLENRHDFFALLTHIVACRAASQIEHELGVQKRGGGRVRGESVLRALVDGSVVGGIDAVADSGRTPSEEAILHDCYERFTTALPENLRTVAEMHLAGATNQEIARQIDCVERTIERKLALIRERWQKLAAESLG